MNRALKPALATILLAGAYAPATWPSTAAMSQENRESPASPLDAQVHLFQMTSQYVSVADGTKLAVDIYRPAATQADVAGRQPVILMHATGLRPSGNRQMLERSGAMAMLEAGYTVVWMEPRGVGASFGKMKGFLTPQNGKDAADVVEWIARQPWSDGKVGMLGTSNMGFIQLLTAAERPKHLKAIAVGVAHGNVYYQLFPNGTNGMVGAPGTKDAPPPPRETAVPVDEDAAAPHAMLQAAEKSHEGGFGLPGEWIADTPRDHFNPAVGYAPGIASSPMMTPERIGGSGVAILQMGAWYDSSVSDQVVAYRLWGGRAIVGNWTHAILAPNQGGPVLLPQVVRWFDWQLRGRENGMAGEAPFRFQTRFSSDQLDWATSHQWPLPGQRMQTLYLGGPSGKKVSLNSGALTSGASSQGRDAFRLDPSVAAFHGKFIRLFKNWPGDMRASTDSKALTYTTAPLPEDMQITGHPVLTLYASSTATDADFVAFLQVVEPDGSSHFVTDGSIRASHRKIVPTEPWQSVGIPFHRAFKQDLAPLEPGKPVELKFALNPVSFVFRAGTRIRLSITGGDAKAFAQPAAVDLANPPTLTVLRSKAMSSRLDLPVIPVGVEGSVLGRAAPKNAVQATGSPHQQSPHKDHWCAGAPCLGLQSTTKRMGRCKS